MTAFLVTVTIETDTIEHARQVVAERIDCDEWYGFDYTIDTIGDLHPLGIIPDRTHVVVVGNPFDGFNFRGPFDSFEQAEAYADREGVMGDWWVGTLWTPQGGEDDNGKPQ